VQQVVNDEVKKDYFFFLEAVSKFPKYLRQLLVINLSGDATPRKLNDCSFSSLKNAVLKL